MGPTNSISEVPVILDVGVGASCIYPLLGNKHFGWKFFGTDVDKKSIEYAKCVVQMNSLDQDISLFEVAPSSLTQSLLHQWCNSSVGSLLGKRHRNPTTCTASTSINNDDQNSIDQIDVSRKSIRCNDHKNDQIQDIIADGDQSSPPLASTPSPHTFFGGYESPLLKFMHESFSVSSVPPHSHSHSHSDRDDFDGPVRRALKSIGGEVGEEVRHAEDLFFHTQKETSFKGEDSMQPKKLISACMTNPPFYLIGEEVGYHPLNTCTGSLSEMFTEGGEVAFILAIVADSLILRDRVDVYSTMIGKKRSLRLLLRVLRQEKSVINIWTTQFQQGEKGKSTVRWGLAWSFLSSLGRPDATNISQKIFANRKEKHRRSACSETHTVSLSELASRTAQVELSYLQEQLHPHPAAAMRSNALLGQAEAVLLSFCEGFSLIRDARSSGIRTIESLDQHVRTCVDCRVGLVLLRLISSSHVTVKPNSDQKEDRNSFRLISIQFDSDNCSVYAVSMKVHFSLDTLDQERRVEIPCIFWIQIDTTICPTLPSFTTHESMIKCWVEMISDPSSRDSDLMIKRKLFFQSSELLLADFCRINRRWKRILDRDRK